jgi:predicted Zn-dependent protease
MMAESFYDPEEAISLWKRMEQVEQVKIPQFLSTHPSSHNRVGQIQVWLAEAQEKRAESGCGRTIGYMDDFRRAFGSGGAREEGFW